jgi:hypothetical protein
METIKLKSDNTESKTIPCYQEWVVTRENGEQYFVRYDFEEGMWYFFADEDQRELLDGKQDASGGELEEAIREFLKLESYTFDIDRPIMVYAYPFTLNAGNHADLLHLLMKHLGLKYDYAPACVFEYEYQPEAAEEPTTELQTA